LATVSKPVICWAFGCVGWVEKVLKPKATFTTAPVSKKTWADFERLFSATGAPHFCWCTLYRFRNAPQMDKAEKSESMAELVGEQTPIGVLAYDGDEAVGWCSIAPRETYVKLERSKTMPRTSDAPTWTILCFFVPRTQRGRGITNALLHGAVAYARASGAEIVEAYPFDSAKTTSTHRGHSSLFRAAGFEHEGKRWFLAARSA
jgi:predicted GNAT family acetyltransferase